MKGYNHIRTLVSSFFLPQNSSVCSITFIESISFCDVALSVLNFQQSSVSFMPVFVVPSSRNTQQHVKVTLEVLLQRMHVFRVFRKKGHFFLPNPRVNSYAKLSYSLIHSFDANCVVRNYWHQISKRDNNSAIFLALEVIIIVQFSMCCHFRNSLRYVFNIMLK